MSEESSRLASELRRVHEVYRQLVIRCRSDIRDLLIGARSRGWSTARVARSVGVTPGYLSLVLRGRSEISVEKYIEIVDLLEQEGELR